MSFPGASRQALTFGFPPNSQRSRSSIELKRYSIVMPLIMTPTGGLAACPF